MKEKKLQTKDLIMAGVFAVLYVALVCIIAAVAGMFIPVFLALPFIAAVILGPVYMLYLSKVPKTGAVLILALLAGFAMSTTSMLVLVYVVLLGIIAQVILSKTDYSVRGIKLSYMVFSCSTMGPFITLYFARDLYLSTCLPYYGQEYVDQLNALTPNWLFVVQLATAVLGGFIGGKIGENMNAKHFEKAGLV